MADAEGPEGEADGGGSTLAKLALSAVIIVAIPGLLVEPGPLSEIGALGSLAAIWLEDKPPSEAVAEGVEP